MIKENSNCELNKRMDNVYRCLGISLDTDPILTGFPKDLSRLLMALSYDDYLKTEYWVEIKKSMHERFGSHCYQCTSRKFLRVHHLRYPPRGQESYNCLMILCADCHAKIHDRPPPNPPPLVHYDTENFSGLNNLMKETQECWSNINIQRVLNINPY
jgi:hypothetical protein